MELVSGVLLLNCFTDQPLPQLVFAYHSYGSLYSYLRHYTICSAEIYSRMAHCMASGLCFLHSEKFDVGTGMFGEDFDTYRLIQT